MSLNYVRLHHTERGKAHNVYQCSFCRTEVVRLSSYVTRMKVRSCGCLRGKVPPEKTMRVFSKITYKGETKTLGEWREQFNIPKNNFDRWYRQGHRAEWIIARYATRYQWVHGRAREWPNL